MKKFDQEFFDIEKFIIKKESFIYSDENNTRTICHVCYNVNDPFTPIMGASIVSILENNSDLAFTFHIFTDGYSDVTANKVKEVARKWQCNCVLYELNMKPFEDFHIKVARFSRITYGRLYMAKVLKGITSRFIYVQHFTTFTQPL